MTILTPTIAIAIIWALVFVLTVTIAFRFYAIHIHDRRKQQRSRRSTRNLPSSTPRNGLTTSKTIVAGCIILVHSLTLLYCVAATLATIWGYDLAEKRVAVSIRYGGAENEVGRELVGNGELAGLRRNVQKVGVAMELSYVVIIWTVKCGLVAVGWQVGRGLGLWGVGTEDSKAEKGAAAKTDGGHAGKEHIWRSEMKCKISFTKVLLNIFGWGSVVTFVGVIIFEAVTVGLALSRTEVDDISSRGLEAEVRERRNAVIVSAVGNLGTYVAGKMLPTAPPPPPIPPPRTMLNFFQAVILSIIFLTFSRSTLQPKARLNRAPLFLYGGLFILFLLLLTVAASAARTGFMIKATSTTHPRVGDLVTAGILYGRVTGLTYGEALGLNAKVLAVIEMMFGGITLCLPGLRVMFNSGRRRSNSSSSRKARPPALKPRNSKRAHGHEDDDLHRLNSQPDQPSPAASKESTTSQMIDNTYKVADDEPMPPLPAMNTSLVVATVHAELEAVPHRGRLSTPQHMRFSIDRNDTFSGGGHSSTGGTIGTRAITVSDVSRSPSRSRSRSLRSRSRDGSQRRGGQSLAATPPPPVPPLVLPPVPAPVPTLVPAPVPVPVPAPPRTPPQADEQNLRQLQIAEQLQWLEQQERVRRRELWEQERTRMAQKEQRRLKRLQDREQASKHHASAPTPFSTPAQERAAADARPSRTKTSRSEELPSAKPLHRISSDKSLPPLPAVSEPEWERARDRELRRLTAGAQLR